MSFGMHYRPPSSTVGRLREDFAEHPYEVPRIKNVGSSRCFPTDWLQAFRQQCLICEFFHPCFDECWVLFLLSVFFYYYYSIDFLCHCCCCYCLHGCPCKLQRLKHIVIGKASRKDCVTNLPPRWCIFAKKKKILLCAVGCQQLSCALQVALWFQHTYTHKWKAHVFLPREPFASCAARVYSHKYFSLNCCTWTACFWFSSH